MYTCMHILFTCIQDIRLEQTGYTIHMIHIAIIIMEAGKHIIMNGSPIWVMIWAERSDPEYMSS